MTTASTAEKSTPSLAALWLNVGESGPNPTSNSSSAQVCLDEIGHSRITPEAVRRLLIDEHRQFEELQFGKFKSLSPIDSLPIEASRLGCDSP